jgi:16S rRNA (cytosine1402-N4)-methyltransferase
MLLDLGVSSHQIDTGGRGFAFMKDGPLDMRMNTNSSTTTASSLTAADICNEFDESTLISILKRYGDEPRAKRIAAAIIESRPLHTTTDLVHAINTVTPTFARQKRAGLIATSARVFQALRIVVNEEDGALEEVLEKVAPWALSKSGSHHSSVGNSIRNGNDGILAVLSYHSMEDKMAKRVIRDGSVDLDGRNGGGGSLFERDLFGNIIESGDEDGHAPFEPLGKPQKATDEEVAVNSRARSATLRVGIRI